MMREFAGLAQERTGHRRLFQDEDMELYLWYESEGGPLVGFQLCYDRKAEQKSITYMDGQGYLHSDIDEGDMRNVNQSPILVQDGPFPAPRVSGLFRAGSEGLPARERDFVQRALDGFRPSMINPLL